MSRSLHSAHPPLDFIPPAFNPRVLRVAHWSLPVLLRWRLRRWLPSGISRIEATNVEALVELYQQFQAGKIRFLMAFRHVEVDDPLSGLYLLSRIVPRVARQQGASLRLPLHAHFLYDRGMPLWGGDWLGWLLSRLGGVPVHRGRRLDRTALRAARNLLMNGQFPFVVAPEGATNGHSEILGPLEPGAAQLSFWCVEDLVKADRSEEVFIIPIGIQYRYTQPSWLRLDRLLSHLESESGLSAQQLEPISDSRDRAALYHQRVCRLGQHLLSEIEEFYARYYPQISGGLKESESAESSLTVRLQRVLNTALQVAEQHFNLSPQGDFNSRCRRIEEAAWMGIYRETLRDLRKVPALQQGLADWTAEEANLHMRHMRMVESCVAVTETYLQEKPSFERLAETALILFDVLARMRGDKLPARPRLGWRGVQLTVGEPISVSQRWPLYQANRQGAKQAVAELTQDLQGALESMIQ